MNWDYVGYTVGVVIIVWLIWNAWNAMDIPQEYPAGSSLMSIWKFVEEIVFPHYLRNIIFATDIPEAFSQLKDAIEVKTPHQTSPELQKMMGGLKSVEVQMTEDARYDVVNEDILKEREKIQKK
jgi:hypothetical protein